MQDKIVIREILLSDIDEIMKMEYLSFPEDVWEKRELFLERIQVFKEGFLIMEIDGKKAGYMTSEIWNYKKERDKSDFGINHSIKKIHNINGNELFITSFAVTPEFRNGGYGKYMFDFFIEKMIKKYNIVCISLIVAEKWEKAIKIYLKNGFKILEKYDDFLISSKDYRDFLFMRKELE